MVWRTLARTLDSRQSAGRSNDSGMGSPSQAMCASLAIRAATLRFSLGGTSTGLTVPPGGLFWCRPRSRCRRPRTTRKCGANQGSSHGLLGRWLQVADPISKDPGRDRVPSATEFRQYIPLGASEPVTEWKQITLGRRSDSKALTGLVVYPKPDQGMDGMVVIVLPVHQDQRLRRRQGRSVDGPAFCALPAAAWSFIELRVSAAAAANTNAARPGPRRLHPLGRRWRVR